MVASLTYRTNDGTRWGGGNGTDLTAQQVDLNFWTLFAALDALQTFVNGSTNAGIDYINQPAGGNLFFVHLTDHRVLGPFVIPTAQWHPQGEWLPDHAYAAYDLVSNDGSLYLITIPHTSGATFSAFATDGLGHLLYTLVLSNPENSLASGGTPGQRLVKSTSSPFTNEWISDHIRLSLFVEGQPTSGETLMQYNVSDHMSLPINLTGSVIFQGVGTASTVAYALAKNGASIGTITFSGPSPETITVSFTAEVVFVPGDIITLTAPLAPDASQRDISFTLLATLLL